MQVKTLLLLSALCVMPLSGVQASDLPAGTIGYLEQQCRDDLQNSQSLTDAFNSYCGGFAEGFIAGVMAASPPDLPEPHKNDPCYEDMASAFETINTRFCPNLPFRAKDNGTIKTAVKNVTDVFFAWLAYQRDKNGSNIQSRPTTDISEILAPGPFCDAYQDYAKKAAEAANHSLPINTALFSISWSDIANLPQVLSETEKHKQCARDIKTANGSPRAFLETRCGGEILGFLSGVRSTSHLLENTTANIKNPQCKKPMHRLYRNLDTTETMCVDRRTHPYTIARIYVENHKLINSQPSLFGNSGYFDLGALGAPGYQTVYRGFVCRNKQELSSR